MAYEYEKENKEAAMINPPKANKELQEVYRKAKAWDSLKEELKRKYEMESEHLKRAEKDLKDDLSQYYDYAIGKINGQRSQLLNTMITMASLEGTNEFNNLLSDLEDKQND